MDARFLPTTLAEGKQYYADFEQFDVVFITGDPYYDHPLSGIAILSRLLDAKGYKVGIIAQPQTDAEYQACARPRYFFCITSGLLDSMLANYTPMLKKREQVLVPERALMVYTQKIKQLYKGAVTVIGGVEATIRRFTHFDYKDNALRRGILNDTKADLLLFGNAERSILTLLQRMQNLNFSPFEEIKDTLDLTTIDGAAFRIKAGITPKNLRVLPSFEECSLDKRKFSLLARMTYLFPQDGFVEGCGLSAIRHNRQSHPLREEEMDFIYGLPYTRKLHPNSKNLALVEDMVRMLETSVPIGRGCWGSCSFCVIPLVQGKEVAKRSKESIVREIEALYASGAKKINDLTLPTLNMYGSYCALFNQEENIHSPIIDSDITVYNKTEYCNQHCVGCKYRKISDDLIPILEEVEKLNKKYKGTELELRSALRHDIVLEQKRLFRKVMQFIQRLKIAPEHISETVLNQMNKANPEAFREFLKEYKQVNEEQGTHKNLVPYFVVAHPGSGMQEMKELKEFCKKEGLFVNLTQVFTPTPGTLSTAVYYTGEDPLTNKTVYVPRSFREKKDQKNVLMTLKATSNEDTEVRDENG
ncbi:DUF3362 domain-containing protein [Candidatus Woesearchaeota archaeon]|nr:DUF3362 domain-containing protein [Candidatus Woesearchaeota archaeon]